MTQLLPAAVLWDMDGTLVDTEPFWMAAEVELVSSFGGTWTHDDGLTLVGAGLWHSAGILRGRGVDLSEDEIVAWLTSRVMESIVRGSVPWRPGALELLAAVKAAGIPMALVTMSIRTMADHVAALAPAGTFDRIIAGDEVPHSKPHPAPYLYAAEALGVDILRCVAIEDSLNGLGSAVASGATSIGVPLHSPLEHGRGYTIWPTLEGRGIADLTELLETTGTRVS